MTELEFLQTATEEDLLTRLPKKEDPYTSE